MKKQDLVFNIVFGTISILCIALLVVCIVESTMNPIGSSPPVGSPLWHK